MSGGAHDYDVIVIGAGGAGLSAAATASETGARVLIIESASQTGGSTALSGGVFYAAGTSLQREAGIDDPGPADAYTYYMTLNQYQVDAGLVRRICDESPEAFEWLRRIGTPFEIEDLYAAGVDKVPRGHRADGGGAAIVAAIEGSMSGRGVDVALETRVDALLVEDGRVAGVSAGRTPIRCTAAIIATGGFGANSDKLARLYPDATRHRDLHWYIGSPHCQGDGLDLAEAAGAALAGLNRGLLLLTPGFAKDLESYLPGWLMLVGGDGRRFIDETIEYSVLAGALDRQPDAQCWAVFDEASRRASSAGTYRAAPNWSADRLAGFAEAGLLWRADTLAELAAAIGIPAAALETSAARYTSFAVANRDEDFFKPSDMLRPVTEPPFYAARVRAAIICWTGTGLAIDREAHVLDRAGRPIPGLYAAGETTGGMFGACYASGGASIANAIVFGRIAGRNAAREAARAAPQEELAA